MKKKMFAISFQKSKLCSHFISFVFHISLDELKIQAQPKGAEFMRISAMPALDSVLPLFPVAVVMSGHG